MVSSVTNDTQISPRFHRSLHIEDYETLYGHNFNIIRLRIYIYLWSRENITDRYFCDDKCSQITFHFYGKDKNAYLRYIIGHKILL